MKEFDYPLDTKTLLRKKVAIKRELLQSNITWTEKKVAVLGGSTTSELVNQLELFLLNQGIKAEFYQSDYGLYYEDAVFGNEALNTFCPDIIYIHTNWRNITEIPTVTSSEDDVNSMLNREYGRFQMMWQSLKEKHGCIIIQNNFDRPDYRILGNRDIWDYRGRCNFLARLNQKFYEYAMSNDSFYINDLDYIAGNYGLTAWNDLLYWNMYKYICPMNGIVYLAQSISNIIKSIYGKNKKLIALDLDNTLWGGVIGDDGVEGIKIGQEIPSGQTYYAFQTYLKKLKQIGVILAVNSKNDENNALEGLSHNDGVLRKEDFVSIKANWNLKDKNLMDISDELSLGLDSFVFVDDNPVERELIKKQIPEVSVPIMEEAENYIKVLDQSGYFEVTSISLEDMNKTDQYMARAAAKSAQNTFNSYEEYLNSLDMKAVITGFEPITVQRVAQLTNKTNQFNLTTLRCSEDDIKKMENNSNYICLCARLIDKFADNGIVTAIAGEIIGFELYIRLWVMSCRVFKRGLEDLMMNELIERARMDGLREIHGYYYPTSKNGIVKDFFANYGFNIVNIDENGNAECIIDVDKYVSKKTTIEKG